MKKFILRLTSGLRPKGQAFVEFVISLIILPVFIMGTITITRMFIVNMRLHQAARLGAFLMATQRVTLTNAQDEVKKYFSQGSPKFDASKLTVKHTNHRVGFMAGDKMTVTYKMKVFNRDKTFTQSVVCGRAQF